MKYVVLEVKDETRSGLLIREVPFIFPDALVHADVEYWMTRLLRKERPDGRLRQITTVSAGFLSSIDLDVTCHGESQSIGTESRGDEDSELIRTMDYSHGVRSI